MSLKETDAKNKVDAQMQLLEVQKQLADTQKQLLDAQKQLADANKRLADAQQKLDQAADAKNKLDAQTKLIQATELKKKQETADKNTDAFYSTTPILEITEDLFSREKLQPIVRGLRENKVLHTIQMTGIYRPYLDHFLTEFLLNAVELKKKHDAHDREINLTYSYTPLLHITPELLSDRKFELILRALQYNQYLRSIQIAGINRPYLFPLLAQVLNAIAEGPCSDLTCLSITVEDKANPNEVAFSSNPEAFKALLQLISIKNPSTVELAEIDASLTNIQRQALLKTLKEAKRPIRELAFLNSWRKLEPWDTKSSQDLSAVLFGDPISQEPDLTKSCQEKLVASDSSSTRSTVQELDISNVRLPEKEFSEFLSKLAQASIKKFILRMPPSILELNALLTFLRSDTTLHSLALKSRCTSANLFRTLSANQQCSIRELECEISPLDKVGFDALYNFVKMSATLEHLTVQGRERLPMLSFFQAIKNNANTALKTFKIPRGQLTPKQIEALIDLLKTNRTLKSAFLSNAGLTDTNLATILQTILNNPGSAVDTLDLAGNRLNTESLKILAALLQQDRIRDLNIDKEEPIVPSPNAQTFPDTVPGAPNTAYDPKAFNELMASLRVNKSLQVLSFRSVVPPQNKAAPNPYSLFQNLVNNPSCSLTTLKFSFDPRYQREVTTLLARNMTLTNLSLTMPMQSLHSKDIAEWEGDIKEVSDRKLAQAIKNQVFSAIQQNPKSIIREVSFYTDDGHCHGTYAVNYQVNKNPITATMAPLSTTMSTYHFAKLDYFYSLIAPVISCHRTNTRYKNSIIDMLPKIFQGLQTSRPEPCPPARTFLNAFMGSRFFRNETQQSNNPMQNNNASSSSSSSSKAFVEEMQVGSQSSAKTESTVVLPSATSKK